jgi:hypothetical protein
MSCSIWGEPVKNFPTGWADNYDPEVGAEDDDFSEFTASQV